MENTLGVSVEEQRSVDGSVRTASKPHSTPLTLKWLEDNYEIAEGVCIPRSTLYMHYLDYCDKNDTQPVNAASFGKIIRQQFPQITTRRLGTRGQSNVNDGKKDIVKQVASYSPRSKLGTLLPEFPSVFDLILPQGVTAEKVTTFLMMYRTHCQRLLDTVIRANFDEVQGFLLHFWQGMPQHIVPILGSSIVVDLVGVCDSILYKTISAVLMPSVLQPLPDSLTQVIRKFARQLDDWLKMALEDLPESLRHMKIDMARRFGQLLKRQTSLNHLCQASRTVIHNAEITSQMVRDWNHVDLASICKQTLYTMDKFNDKDHDMIAILCREFEDLLQEQAPLESYTRWLDAMVERCVVQPATTKPESVRRIARQFLLMWSCFGTRIIRDMTLQSAPSFGSFHLLHLMFDDYVLFMVESLHCQERSNELLRSITGRPKPVDYEDDVILPKPSFHPASTIVTSSPTGTGSTVPTHAHYVQERQSVITDGREAFASTHSCAAIHSQPPTPSIRPVVTSPSRSSMTSYDGRNDVEVRHHVSPQYVTDAPINLQMTTQAITDGYDRYGGSSRGHHSSTDLSPYPYSYVNSTPYGTYRSRDYGSGSSSGAITTSSDWMDTCQQRYAQRALSATSQDYQSTYYNSYGYSRTPSDYEVAMYGYTGSLHSSVMRTNEADGGAAYQHSGVVDSSVLYQPGDVESVGKGKRKILDIMNVDRSCVKRHYTNEYAGYEQTTAFHNTTGLHQT